MSEISGIDELLELMRTRRSIRRFAPQPVPQDYEEKILEAARWASSGANSQPWEVVVIKDQETRGKIARIFEEAHRDTREKDPDFPVGEEDAVWRKYAEAPLLMVICGDTRFQRAYPSSGKREAVYILSLGQAMAHMLLAATALGLGACWGSVGYLAEKRLRDLLAIPEALEIKEVFSFGFPAQQPKARYRRPVAEFRHMERFDPGKLRTEEQIKELLATRRTADIYSGTPVKV